MTIHKDFEVEDDRVRGLVIGFRRAIEQTDFSDTTLNLANFPRQCCHHACKLLWIYLYENGITGLTQVVGKGPENATDQHLWLDRDGLFIDITADQFTGIDDKVIVCRDSNWHSQLNPRPSTGGPQNEPDSYYARMKSFYESNGGIYSRILQNVVDRAF
jgi:hypothetical protein